MNNNQYTYNQPPIGPGMPPQGGMMPPQQAPMPMSRRARMGRRLMAEASAFINSLPRWFASYAVGAYVVALLGVSVLFSAYAMEWYFMLFGVVWVAGFFFLSVKLSHAWSVIRVRRSRSFERKLFQVGFWMRVAYAIFIYIFYSQMTGQPHEFAAADSASYIETAQDFSIFMDEGLLWKFLAEEAAKNMGDIGYPLVIMYPVRWFGVETAIMLILLANAFIGAYTTKIIYRMSQRSMGETTARIAAIFCMLHPVFICYVGVTLKEVLMTFLLVEFINLGDNLLRGKRYSFSSIAPMILIGMSLFLFRTVLGVIAFMAIFFALVMMDSKIVSWGKKLTFGTLIAGILLMAVSDNIIREVNKIRETDVREEQETAMNKRYGSEKGGEFTGNRFANYASAAVFAPLIFTIPFPTMVDVGFQQDIRLIHGGNWMRNVMSGFVILAMFMLLLSGDWRKYTLPLAMMLGYLLMLAFTAFAHSLRFHIPVMPFEMMFAAYAITNMRKKHRMWYLIWCMFMVVACFGWNWMKLSGRGLS